ncbi:MAG TPA: PD-(D/E)XK nuclease family protein [Solirubrobacteraceae bacterium]|nr:PD-(D/E)XK nuclease family protein [Solirubrobacteraceae bacterium]
MAASHTAPELAADPGGGASHAQDAQRRESETGFLRRAEVRDVLAWMRLLVDPQDAAAVVRALARPPIELRQTHLARVIQVARRRKLDLVSGLTAASESPQVPPEARERIARFVRVHRSAAGGLDTLAPDAFMAELIELLGTPGRALLTPAQAAERDASLQGLRDLTIEFVRSEPEATPRELARHLARVVPRARSAGAATPVAEAPAQAESESPDEHLEEAYQLLREEVLESVARIGGHLGELRLDTELDISHGVVRYLELIKLAALLQRPTGQTLDETLADVNSRLLAATTPVQREIFQTSSLDDALTQQSRVGGREHHSLEPFLPRKGEGLALSASDIETYRSCPLRYKFARVLRIPTEQTPHQRFGIVVHQVLERFHCDGAKTLAQMHELLDTGWRRAGFGESDEYERELLAKARTALDRYHERLSEQDSEPVWFERSFSFQLGPHHLRGRVDRVDRISPSARSNTEATTSADATMTASGGTQAEAAGEEYELIDYKTSRPKSAEQLSDDVQLSLYALAAREAWGLESSRQAYYYVLDDLKVPVPRGTQDEASVADLVMEVGEGILAQEFEPTPSHAACSICDYRIVCPVAEK